MKEAQETLVQFLGQEDPLEKEMVLFSHKKECIWVSSDEMDEPRTYYTEWSESERKR